jgi:FemAB-related protein (PEP-CTERM system-associated)
MTAPGLSRVAASAAPVVVGAEATPEACAAYVAAHPLARGYHHPRWLEVVHKAFGHRTLYLAAEREGAIVGVLPLVFFASRLFGRSTVSMPFLNYGGVLADDPGVERALLDRAIAETRAAGGASLELRHTRQVFPDLAAKRHKVAMLLGLESTPERQWERLDRKVRNQVRKAEKSGLTVRFGGQELVPDFYGVFARNMRDLGTPVYGVRFFDEVLAAFADGARVFVVSTAERPVAASIVVWHGATMEVPWASALREYNPLCPNVLLYWHMLRFAIEQRCTVFDFGRSTPNEGTFHFKRQWGAEPQPLVWEYWMADGRPVPDLSPKNRKFSVAIRAWQRLPVRVATWLGPHIVRHIP